MQKGGKKYEKLKSLVQGYSPISRFAIYTGVNQTKVLIVAYFRSGSSFLGDLMQQNWKSFYSFEPLNYMTRQTRIDGSNVTEATELINSILDCDFSNRTQYIKWIQTNQYLVKWNKFLWNICKFRLGNNSCYNESSLQHTCQRSKYNIIKVVRLQLKHLDSLWRKVSANHDLRIVYLVRDPRGIYNSRKTMEWCAVEDLCSNITNICAEMREDLQYYEKLKHIIGDRLVMLRYEDLSVDTVKEAKHLFTQIGIPYSASVSTFIRAHTKSRPFNDRNTNPYSTYRENSSSTAYQWTKELNETEIEFAQQTCDDVLRRLDYKFL